MDMNGGSNSVPVRPDGSYGPYVNIVYLGKACGAKLKSRAQKYSRICSPGQPIAGVFKRCIKKGHGHGHGRRVLS